MTLPNSRIYRDVKNLRNAGFKLKMIKDDDMHMFFVEFHGPKHSLYHGYVWRMIVSMTDAYPNEPPFVLFSDKIYHPNIKFESGDICVNLLNKKFWSSDRDLVFVFQTVIPKLLKKPNPDDPFNTDAAALFLLNRELYEVTVKEFCAMHATKKESSDMETDVDEIQDCEDDTLSEIDEQMGKLDIEEGKDDNASEDENVFGKADDPRGRGN